MQVYQDSSGGLAISRDDHRHYCDALLALTRPLGGNVQTLMRFALESGAPRDRDAHESVRYFGPELPLIVKMLGSLVVALDEVIPDFKQWMVLTRFGNDKDFILALLAIDRALATLPKLRGKDRRMALASIMPKIPDTLDHAGTRAFARSYELSTPVS
jgi:hypothetical protein